MKIKEQILPLADAYAIEKLADAMHERQIKGDSNKARATLCDGLDAVDAKLTAAVLEIARLTEDYGYTLMELEMAKTERHDA